MSPTRELDYLPPPFVPSDPPTIPSTPPLGLDLVIAPHLFTSKHLGPHLLPLSTLVLHDHICVFFIDPTIHESIFATLRISDTELVTLCTPLPRGVYFFHLLLPGVSRYDHYHRPYIEQSCTFSEAHPIPIIKPFFLLFQLEHHAYRALVALTFTLNKARDRCPFTLTLTHLHLTLIPTHLWSTDALHRVKNFAIQVH